jgi:DNA polymerase-3 subunit alpha
LNTRIDIDYDALERQKAIDWVVNKWGRECVANIITHGTLKPKSLTKKYFKVTEDTSGAMYDILENIPAAEYGKEPTLEEVVAAFPKLPEKYPVFYDAAKKLENMVSNFGVHAGGVVISDFPISDIVPLWAKTESEPQANGTNRQVDKWVTQFDMKECETHG